MPRGGRVQARCRYCHTAVKVFGDICFDCEPGHYADTLVGLVKADIAREPARFASVHSFQDLHDVVDANEYILEADEMCDIDTMNDRAPAFMDKVMEKFHQHMGWTQADARERAIIDAISDLNAAQAVADKRLQ